MEYMKSIFFFVLAGLFEIGGGFLIWLSLREGRGGEFAIIGAIVLVLYGIIPTRKLRQGLCSIWRNIHFNGIIMGLANRQNNT